jgi:hypothetical protein
MSGRRCRPPVARGSAVLAMAALLALAGGCSSAGAAAPSARHTAPAPAARRSAAAVATPLAPAQREALAHRYLAIAAPANQRLDHEVDRFADHQRSDLAAAQADLRAEAATERRFDRQLAGIPFPHGIAVMARALIRANQSRAALTDREARSVSLAELHSYAARHRAADASVEFGVRLIRQALSLPPPSDS